MIVILFSAISYFLPLSPKYLPHDSTFNRPQPDLVSRPCTLTGSITVLIRVGQLRADTNCVLIILRNDMKTPAAPQNFSANTQMYRSLSGNTFVHSRRWVRHCLLQQFLSNRHSRPCLPEFVLHTCVDQRTVSTFSYLPDRNLVFVMEAHSARLQVTEELPLSEGIRSSFRITRSTRVELRDLEVEGDPSISATYVFT